MSHAFQTYLPTLSTSLNHSKTMLSSAMYQNHSSNAGNIQLPLESYPLNRDPDPIVIHKKPTQSINYKQEIKLRFLKPPTPQQPGDIIIRQEKDVQIPAAPPLLVRQKPPEPAKLAPIIVREKPPSPPPPIEPKFLTLPGKILPPPPRKVIVERLPKMPQPPQDVVVERWLGYSKRQRRVVFQPAPKFTPALAPKNEIIEWESPDVQLDRKFNFLGVQHINPHEYAEQYASSLMEFCDIPAIAATNFRPPPGEEFACEAQEKPVEFVGDVHALSLIRRQPN